MVLSPTHRAALNATATVISTCTSGAAAQITMNAGASAGSGSTDVPVRRMTAGASEYLVYQVYSDVSRKRFGAIPPHRCCTYWNWPPSNP